MSGFAGTAGGANVSDEKVKLAWHYTVGVRMAEILKAQELRPATAGVPQGEIPVVWFSTRPFWEPTANKSLQNDQGEIVRLGFEQTIEHGGGGWRFGVPTALLLPWRELKIAARIAPQWVRGLKQTAKKIGSDPMHWYGSIQPVPIDTCTIERLDGDAWIEP
jgi:hypothetical protein